MFCYRWFDENGRECESEAFDSFAAAEYAADMVGGWVIDLTDDYCDSMKETCSYY